MVSHALIFAGLLSTALLASPAASQVPLPIPFQGNISIESENIVQRSTRPFTVSANRASGSVTISASDVNGGTVMTAGFTSGGFILGSAGLYDTIMFSGPPNSVARVRLVSLGQLAVTGSGNALAALAIYNLDQETQIFSAVTLLNSTGGSQFRNVRFAPSFTMPANSTFAFQLGVRGTALDGPGSFFAILDPVISISAIPEPESWALLIAGFGLVGAAIRRRPVLT